MPNLKTTYSMSKNYAGIKITHNNVKETNDRMKLCKRCMYHGVLEAMIICDYMDKSGTHHTRPCDGPSKTGGTCACFVPSSNNRK